MHKFLFIHSSEWHERIPNLSWHLFSEVTKDGRSRLNRNFNSTKEALETFSGFQNSHKHKLMSAKRTRFNFQVITFSGLNASSPHVLFCFYFFFLSVSLLICLLLKKGVLTSGNIMKKKRKTDVRHLLNCQKNCFSEMYSRSDLM